MSDEQSLLGAVFLDLLNDTPPTESDIRVLRDRTTHLRVVPSTSLDNKTQPPATMAGDDAPAGDPAPQAPLPPMKVLPQTYKVTPFSSSDPSYHALDFLTQCEDAFELVLALDPKDKINFVRQQLECNSRAFNMQKSLDFQSAHDQGDYDKFRTLFLITFGDARVENVVKVPSSSVEEILKGQASHAVYDAQIPAGKITEDAIRVLKSGDWSDGASITFDKLTTFLYLFHYMIFLKSHVWLATLSLTYKPTESPHTFCDKLNTKLIERQGVLGTSTVAATSSAVKASPAAAASSQGKTSAVPQLCTYCNKTGHLYARCYQRLNALKCKKASDSRSSPSAPAATCVPASAPPAPRSAQAVTKMCEIHGPSTHSTAECHTIQHAKANFLERRATPPATMPLAPTLMASPP